MVGFRYPLGGNTPKGSAVHGVTVHAVDPVRLDVLLDESERQRLVTPDIAPTHEHHIPIGGRDVRVEDEVEGGLWHGPIGLVEYHRK